MPETPLPIILALDVPTQVEALQWVRRLKSRVPVFKVGMQLFYKYGPALVEAIRAEGVDVFLDLKLHDIPNTVARACESLLPLAPRFLTVHVSGGPAMLEAAQAAVAGSPISLLGITALTSLDATALKAIYPTDTPPDPSAWALELAGVAQQAGLHGVVCSARENAAIRQRWGDGLCLVNPGIRLAGDAVQDQKRVETPGQALAAGGNLLVIGRPILQATDPEAALAQIAEDIAHANRLPA